MGNSLLDVCVFGRRAGMTAAQLCKEVSPGKPTIRHLVEWKKQLDAAGINGALKSPILIPNYARRG